MDYITAKPSALLAPYVKGYWELNNFDTFSRPYDYRVVPSGLPELTFYLGHTPISKDVQRTFDADTLICGHKKNFQDILIADKFTMFSVLFYPQGLMAFLNIPLSEFYNRNIPLHYLFKAESLELESKLQEAFGFKERVKHMETFLLKKLSGSEKRYEYRRISHAVNLITDTRAGISIAQLAEACCLSRKQFERSFAEHIGTTPKQFLRTIRFQYTLAQKASGKDRNLTELAHRCGYYDQSHMINDFKNLSGFTPSEYFDFCEPTSDYFML